MTGELPSRQGPRSCCWWVPEFITAPLLTPAGHSVECQCPTSQSPLSPLTHTHILLYIHSLSVPLFLIYRFFFSISVYLIPTHIRSHSVSFPFNVCVSLSHIHTTHSLSDVHTFFSLFLSNTHTYTHIVCRSLSMYVYLFLSLIFFSFFLSLMHTPGPLISFCSLAPSPYHELHCCFNHVPHLKTEAHVHAQPPVSGTIQNHTVISQYLHTSYGVKNNFLALCLCTPSLAMSPPTLPLALNVSW